MRFIACGFAHGCSMVSSKACRGCQSEDSHGIHEGAVEDIVGSVGDYVSLGRDGQDPRTDHVTADNLLRGKR